MHSWRWPAVLTGFVLLLSAPALLAESGDRRTFEKTYALSPHKEVTVGIRNGEATVESFQIRKWPTEDQLEKGDRDADDTHSMDVELRYTNLNHSRDYKCRTTVVVLGPKDGTVYAEEDTTKSFNKGKSDTYRLSVKMKTRYYRTARSLKLILEIWKD